MATKPKKKKPTTVLGTETPNKANEFVDKTEFDSFRSETQASLKAVLDAIEAKSVAPAPVTTQVRAESKQDAVAADPYTNGYLPQQYQNVFEKYFDPTDGFTARLTFPEVNDQGQETGGINFTIFVPLKLSNTDDGYRKMYKQDLRTRALLPHNIAKGIDDWCKAVANNLKYNKVTKRK